MARKKTTPPTASIIPAERIERSILVIRGEKVLLDRDLADLYQVETRVLIQAVKRNIGRFPADFMFQLSTKERKNGDHSL
jgi:ORF6N domain